MSEHTPTPWIHQLGGHGCKELVFSTAGNGCLVATCSSEDTPDAPANAAHIERCVNAHDDLVAACKAAVNQNYDGGLSGVIALCETAIAKAKEVKPFQPNP